MFLNNLHRNTPELETTGKLQKQSHFIPWPLLTTHHDRHFLLTVKENPSSPKASPRRVGQGKSKVPQLDNFVSHGAGETRRETAEENPQ